MTVELETEFLPTSVTRPRAPGDFDRVAMILAGHCVDVIRYVGSYRFLDRMVLEHALTAARALLDDDDDFAALEGRWLRCFRVHGTMLMANIALPALPEHRFLAAEVFGALSREAIEGCVKATIASVEVDEFVSGDEG